MQSTKPGLVGERKYIAMYYAPLDSRLLPWRISSKSANYYGVGRFIAMIL